MATKITVRFDDSGEHRVPGPEKTEAQAYYTDDRDDAIWTARSIFGRDVEIKFRRFEYADPSFC